MNGSVQSNMMHPSRSQSLPPLIAGLMAPGAHDHPVGQCELIETHASWVILAGRYAYKIKKPVNLGFLDFSTLEKRQFCCEEELRLNRRLAPEIYLGLAPVFGTAARPRLHGSGPIIEYAVKMVQFPQEAQLDHALAAGRLKPVHIDAFALRIADFHGRIAVAVAGSGYGDPEHIRNPVLENFIQIRKHIPQGEMPEPFNELEAWTLSGLDALLPAFLQRKAGGFIRECHGDLHLRNLAWIDNQPVGFDCIEFSPNLRWIDVISDIAFLVMDLQDRHQPQLAQRFLNRYLEQAGDYGGLRLLPFYLTYRAMVRAKVNAILAGQPGVRNGVRAEALKEFSDYLAFAGSHTRPGNPQLIITCGLSASGKSTLTEPILEHIGAIRIRSDVERKRCFGLRPEADGRAAVGEGMYSEAATKNIYERLAALAAGILDAGFAVIVDAAFLRSDQRRKFRKLAHEKKVPFRILEFRASPETLRRRITDRPKGISDAGPDVLEHQLRTWQPLSEEERPHALEIDTEAPLDARCIADRMIN